MSVQVVAVQLHAVAGSSPAQPSELTVSVVVPDDSVEQAVAVLANPDLSGLALSASVTDTRNVQVIREMPSASSSPGPVAQVSEEVEDDDDQPFWEDEMLQLVVGGTCVGLGAMLVGWCMQKRIYRGKHDRSTFQSLDHIGGWDGPADPAGPTQPTADWRSRVDGHGISAEGQGAERLALRTESGRLMGWMDADGNSYPNIQYNDNPTGLSDAAARGSRKAKRAGRRSRVGKDIELQPPPPPPPSHPPAFL